MQSLGFLPGDTRSYAFGVSGDGSVIVGLSDTPTATRAFRWTSQGGMQELGPLSGGNSSVAKAISKDGSVIVGEKYSNFGSSAFLWTESGGMQDLGTLPGGTSARAEGASGDGSSIVGQSNSSSGTSAFLWSSGSGMIDLNTYLPTLGVDLTGWKLTGARSISEDGSTIVGFGAYGGVTRAFAVSGVPEPSALSLLSVGLGALAMMRRRRL